MRFCGKKKIQHKPEHHKYGAVQLATPCVSLVQPGFCRMNVGRATMSDMVDFCQSKGITLENISKPLWELRTDESSLEINGSDEKNKDLLQESEYLVLNENF